MNNFKKIPLVLIAVAIFSAITGVQSAHVTINSTSQKANYSTFEGNEVYGRLLNIFNAIIFALLYYGICKRLFIAWRLGWVLLVLVALTQASEIWLFSTNISYPQNIIISFTSIFFGIIALSYWGLWWKRQRSYFVKN